MVYKKDRKVLKRVDYGAAKTSIMGVLAALLVYTLVFAWGEVYSTYEFETLLGGAAVLLVTAYRLWLFARFDALYGAGPARWRRLFGLGLVLHASLWGLLPAWLLWKLGPTFSFFAMLFYNMGVTTALGSSWMAGLRVRQMYIVLMFLPSFVVFALDATRESIVMGLLILTYVFYLFRMYRAQYETFWHAVTRERRIRAESAKKAESASNNHSVQLSLVYRLAHELRTPMNSLMGMMSLLEDTDLNDEQRDYLHVADRSGGLLLSQIDDVLDYSRILTRRITLSPDYFDFRAALEQTLEAYALAALQKNIELSCVVDRLAPKRVRGDRERLMQVVNNLLSNAIKFSDSGEIRIDVGFKPERENAGTLTVSVTDQGPGMSTEAVKSLFEDHFSGGETDPFSARRTGFGLLVCKGLIDAMGGQLEASSELGAGSVFRFSIPAEVQPDMREGQLLSRALPGAQCLIAGASAGTVAALQEELEALDYQCASAESYDHALQALREGHREHSDFDILLIDTCARAELALNLCRNVLDDPSLRPIRLGLLCSLEERSQPAIQALIDKHDLAVLVKPAHRNNIRQCLYKLAGVERQQYYADASHDSPEEQKRRSGFRLLLVEDNEVNQLVTRGMLSKLGYQVKTVSDATKALSLVEEEAFELVLMDCMMPGMDGFEATRQLRAMEQSLGRPRVPIIAITANTAEGAQARCLASGMDDFLAKPIHLEALETVLRRWLPTSMGREGDE